MKRKGSLPETTNADWNDHPLSHCGFILPETRVHWMREYHLSSGIKSLRDKQSVQCPLIASVILY